MAESESGQEKTLDASAKRLADARAKGDVPTSREGSSAGSYGAALLTVMLMGGFTAHKIGDLLVPLFDIPDQFTDLTEAGFEAAGRAALTAIAVALAPVFGLLIAGALLPQLMQGSVTATTERLMPKLSNMSPAKAVSRMFGGRAMFEFAKNIVKMLVVGAGCYVVARPLFDRSMGLVNMDPAALLPLLEKSLVSLLGVVTLVAIGVAAIDVPYQHWSWRRKLRMTLEEMKEELKETDGNPHVKGRLRRLRMERATKRMMHDVKTASVVITNPTHYAVALRYDRGKDAAPIVVAKGLDLVAQNIKKIARENNVAVVEDRPLARALHAAVEIGQQIPREHFEAVAKIIGLIWAQKGKVDRGTLDTSAAASP